MMLSSAARQFRSIARTTTLTRCALAASSTPTHSLSIVTPSSSASSCFSSSQQQQSQPSTASLVKQLRELTGAPMMECKKALSAEEVQNDISKAQEWLRKHGSAKASSKVAGREALEGLVGIHISNKGGSKVATLAKVASETDFASRSESFSSFVQSVADAAASNSSSNDDEPVDIPTFMTTTKNVDGQLLSESLNDAILAIRENIQVDSISIMKPSHEHSIFAGYVHGRAPNSTCGTSAAVVEVSPISNSPDNETKTEQWEEAVKKLAMHVVAAKPTYLDPSTVPEEAISKEKEILKEKMADSKKPPEILEKIITGQLRKFYEGVCLTEQAHMVEEGGPKVKKVMESLGLEVKGFRLMGMSK
mmetsp:Transcript_25069/g.50176  ORF Transcript_25069/g.50176 Transcript_25069/m.50176 type:complete len:363 (-) Transcript_25069:172-1260(-)